MTIDTNMKMLRCEIMTLFSNHENPTKIISLNNEYIVLGRKRYSNTVKLLEYLIGIGNGTADTDPKLSFEETCRELVRAIGKLENEIADDVLDRTKRALYIILDSYETSRMLPENLDKRNRAHLFKFTKGLLKEFKEVEPFAVIDFEKYIDNGVIL